jgi:hypothetical protein
LLESHGPWKRKLATGTVDVNDQAAYSNGPHEHIKKQVLTFVIIHQLSIFIDFSNEYAATQLSKSIDPGSNSKCGNWQAALD